MTETIVIPTDTDIQRLISALNAAHGQGIQFTLGPNPHIAWDEIGQQYAPAGQLLRDEEFTATWAGGHALVIEYGDCEFYGRRQCGETFGMVKPDRFHDDAFGDKWERHVMGLGR